VNDEFQLQIRPKDSDSSLSPAKARSGLAARGRRDAAALTAYERRRMAAEQGDAEQQFVLGCMYYDGEGVDQDYAEAAKWYRMAAAQGDDLSEFALGVMYAFGQGVAQDYGEAAKWYREAANRGSDKAQFSLGMLYKFGAGVAKDHVQAHMWMSLGASHTHDEQLATARASALHNMAAEMNPAQIAEAQHLALVFEEERKQKVDDIMASLKRSLEARKARRDPSP
jgi:TPR repeat protein